MPANMGLDISYKSVKFSYYHFPIDQNTPFYPPPPPKKKFAHYHRFQSLVSITAVPKEIEKNNGYEKKGGQSALWSM